MQREDAWYHSTRREFVVTSSRTVVDRLNASASKQGWFIESEQQHEWAVSVDALQDQLALSDGSTEGTSQAPERLEILRSALAEKGMDEFHDVILEYNLRRRGLRIDCVLLGPGIVAVVEFKRSRPTSADRDQVTNYCINLVEFHEETQEAVGQGTIVVPILVTTGKSIPTSTSEGFLAPPWDSIVQRPFECSASELASTLSQVLALRVGQFDVTRKAWLGSRFAPSSNILDAAISLFGDHDVSAISSHAAPVEVLENSVAEALTEVKDALSERKRRVVFVSGAPGAGKTLVGLKIAFARELREQAVFVTGNAPLVEVLSSALKSSYRRRSQAKVISGYAKDNVARLIDNTTFKIVKAHRYLGDRASSLETAHERVVVFDEAQRTYAKDRMVLRKPLPDDEAHLILSSLEESFPDEGTVVVALIGHNQTINSGEMGPAAWLKAAERNDWEYSISDETFSLGEFSSVPEYREHPLRRRLKYGHLAQSLRFYRNANVERWVHAVLGNDPGAASSISDELNRHGHTIWMTRSLKDAKRWGTNVRVGEERAGVIASGQGRRLAAHGIHVDLKPSIADWMLAPSGDIRSSNMLETAQNQFQIQGLELDYTIVCWDIDLRRAGDGWAAFKMSGSAWRRNKDLNVAKSGYRVLLTRARKGMVIVVPRGDDRDSTRPSREYDEIAEYLAKCGCRVVAEGTESK